MEIEKLYKLSLMEHYSCEDSWFSCPKAEHGCANDAEPDECNCGADLHNNAVTELFYKIKSKSKTWQDQPTTEGHYWFKDKNGIMMARLRKLSFGNEKVEINFMGNLHDYLLSELSGKWYGPITPPKED